MSLFDRDTIMKNHDAAIRREGRKEGRAEEREDLMSLMSYLVANGRSDDIIRAWEDESFLNELIEEFHGGIGVAL